MSWRGAAVLGVLMGATTMMSEATPTTDLEALLEASASSSRGERLEALHKLGRLSGPIKDPRLAAGLAALAPTDTEAALRLELLARIRDPAARPAVLAWSHGAMASAKASVAELAGSRRALSAALRIIAESSDPGADAVLLGAAALDDPAVERVALEGLDGRPGFQASQHVPALIRLLGATLDGESQSHVLSLLGRSRSRSALQPVLESMERWAELNPDQGALAHAAALRALTGQSLGDRPAPWRAWLRAQAATGKP